MRLSVKVDGRLVRQGLENLAGEIPMIGRRRIYRVMQSAMKELRKPGQKPTYPIQWDSEKQRRAFFATDGFGRGIPAKRTGDYVGGWKLERMENGYALTNDTEHAKYVGGDAYGRVHSRIHSGRWVVTRDVVEEAVATLPDEIEDDIRMVARRIGFEAR